MGFGVFPSFSALSLMIGVVGFRVLGYREWLVLLVLFGRLITRKVDMRTSEVEIRLPGKENSNTHGARQVY